MSLIQKNVVINIFKSLSSEIINILLSALAGFLMIRQLPKSIYGVYGFLITAINLIVSLSEVGINHCFLPLVGYKDVSESRIEAIAIFFKEKRLKLFYVSSAVVFLPILWIMFKHDWFSPVFIISVSLMLFASIFSINEQLQRQKFTALHDSKLIANSNFFSSLIRTLWILFSLYIIPENLTLIFLSVNAAVGNLVGIYLYNKRQNDKSGLIYYKENFNELTVEFEKIYKPLRLPAFLYVLYANFGSMAIGLFGNTATMANVNAAGRLGMCLVLVDKLVGIFVIPKLAQAENGNKYKQLLLHSLGVYGVFVFLILLSSYLLPQVWLLLIGYKYADLQNILWLCFLGVILSNFAGFLFTCMTARGFTGNQLPIFVTAVFCQIVATYFIGMYTAKSVFVISIITAGVFAGGNLFLLWLRLKKLSIN